MEKFESRIRNTSWYQQVAVYPCIFAPQRNLEMLCPDVQDALYPVQLVADPDSEAQIVTTPDPVGPNANRSSISGTLPVTCEGCDGFGILTNFKSSFWILKNSATAFPWLIAMSPTSSVLFVRLCLSPAHCCLAIHFYHSVFGKPSMKNR